MSTTLSKEINKFYGLRNRLKQIIADTKRCYEDINISGRFEGTQLINTQLQPEEEFEITSVVKHPPTIIIFGQTTYAKSRIVNELLSRNIFPVLDENSIAKLRMVRIVHGTSNTFSCLQPGESTQPHNPETNGELQAMLELSHLEIHETDRVKKSSFVELKVTQNHQLLKSGVQIVVSPSCEEDQVEDAVRACLENCTTTVIYGFASDILTEEDVLELSQISKQTNFAPVFFVRVPPPGARTVDTDPPDGEPGEIQTNSSPSHSFQADSVDDTTLVQHIAGTKTSVLPVPAADNEGATGEHTSHVYENLQRLGYLDCDPEMKKFDGFFSVDSCFVENFTDFGQRFATFTGKMLQRYLANASTLLNNSHTCCMKMFILSAFDMARDMLITPKKLEFVRQQEQELYRALLKISVSKLDEVKEIITNTISIIRTCLIAEAAEFDFIGIEINQNGVPRTVKELKLCEEQIRELILGRLNHVIAGKLVSSVNILRDSYTGTLTRCLESLETMNRDSPDGETTTDALRQILNAAYTVDITVRSSSSFIKSILEKMKQLVYSLPWRSSPTIDSDWKRKVATDMLNSLSESRLAKSISMQIKERLNKSHIDFTNALKQLEMSHTGRLDKIEEHRLKLRKIHAPQLAKLALESTSLKDVVLYDMPQIDKEIGRGQYGVVYSCDRWGSFSPCAIKSVVPPDDKHWNDLALEFFYTKHIPDHDRIVMLRGSVIDYMYGGGTSPAVLLVMDRLQRDLHTAIRQNLDWISRLQVAIDVVEGLRYLHSQGLVHRDVKLKNVLLDKDNRGKVTDLGFCKPEVMMSGSIVGTPIHMAPELFTGHYDNSVDVYAFGILFWYVCAGHVHLPRAFEQCANKDHLWQSVKKGLRPEQPENVSEDCWKLMQGCWEGEPHQRPLFGEVENTLKVIYEKDKRKAAMAAERRRVSSDQNFRLARRSSKPLQIKR